MKADIDMGSQSGGKAAMLDLEELLATRLLVQGNSGSGKSHLLRRLLEQSAPWVQQCVIDPEGDFVTLADRYGHVVVDAERTEAELTRIAARIRQHVLQLRQGHDPTVAVAHRGDVAHLGQGDQALLARVVLGHAVEQRHLR